LDFSTSRIALRSEDYPLLDSCRIDIFVNPRVARIFTPLPRTDVFPSVTVTIFATVDNEYLIIVFRPWRPMLRTKIPAQTIDVTQFALGKLRAIYLSRASAPAFAPLLYSVVGRTRQQPRLPLNAQLNPFEKNFSLTMTKSFHIFHRRLL